MRKSQAMPNVEKIELDTVNRGKRLFTISASPKGFFAHEIGEQFPASDTRKAHRLNPTRKVGNQYGKYFIPVPAKTIEEASALILEAANTEIIYG